MSAIAEKGGGFFQGIKLLLCENPLLPIDEAIAAAQAGVPHSNFYTEPYPTKTYFFLADFAPYDAFDIADQLRSRNILIKPLNDPVLGPGYMRITTALPDDNRRFVDALREVLSGAQEPVGLR